MTYLGVGATSTTYTDTIHVVWRSADRLSFSDSRRGTIIPREKSHVGERARDGLGCAFQTSGRHPTDPYTVRSISWMGLHVARPWSAGRGWALGKALCTVI
jgi:hypothetical protein